MGKIDELCERKAAEVFRHPHVGRFGVSRQRGETYIAVIKQEQEQEQEQEQDTDDGWTEMSKDEECEIRKVLAPYNVRFFDPLMLTFPEWLSGVKRRDNPITGKEYICR